MTEPIVRVSDLTYYYPGDAEPVLQDVNLEIYPGEFALLIGPSGCGKSTLALALNGIVPLVFGGRIKGRVFIDGVDTRESTVYELGTKIGIVFQDPDTQLCNLRVEDEIAFGPANLMMGVDEVLRRIDQSLQDVEETRIRHRLIYEISGGQKQRVAIASILAMEPKIVVFDEPTANLDPRGAVQIFNFIKRLNREKGITVIVIEHIVDSVMRHADRLLLMEKGTIRYNLPPREAMQQNGHFVLDSLGLRIPQVSELGLRLAGKGLHLTPFPLTLDEAAQALAQQKSRLEFEPAAAAPAANGAAPAVIRAEHLDFTYADGTHAVKDVSLQIERGDVVGIVGKNGSGKTTLTSLLIGLNRPTGGTATVSGLDIGRATTRELAGKIGYVFQYPEHQFVEDTVYKEVAFSLKAQKRPPAEVDARVNQVLDLLGLEKMKQKHPFRLSMGQKRRLSVATMLILNLDTLILDEPTTGQDRKNIDNIMEIMMEVNRRDTTILLITHDMNLVSKYCRRILVMDEGQVVYFGAKDDFCRRFAAIRSDALVLPEIYELSQMLRERQGLPAPELFTVDEFVAAAKVH